MKAHEKRVVEEATELDERITRLQAFIEGPTWQFVDGDEQARMRRQLELMTALYHVLLERIAHFP